MKERAIPVPILLLLFGLIVVCLWKAKIRDDEMNLKVNQLKAAITGPERNPNWSSGHTSVAIVKHSPNCECLK